MKIFSSELGHNYDTYTFGYAQYAVVRNSDSLEEVYERGFLPYSGAADAKGVFYMARSARVPLPKWEMTSENRRIAKRFDSQFTKTRTPAGEFRFDERFYSFCLAYFARRHGARAMPRPRLAVIVESGLISHVITYRAGNKLVGYVLEVSRGGMAHYWFSFYDLSLIKQSLGLWLMLDCVREAAEQGLTHYYLGTVYGKKALYKTNFKPLEWWDGAQWSGDIALLRSRARSDDERVIALIDEWKRGKKLFG